MVVYVLFLSSPYQLQASRSVSTLPKLKEKLRNFFELFKINLVPVASKRLIVDLHYEDWLRPNPYMPNKVESFNSVCAWSTKLKQMVLYIFNQCLKCLKMIFWFYFNDSIDLFHPRNLLQSFVGVHQLGLGLEEPVDVLVH